MKEDFLHFIWKQKLFNQNDLATTSGETIEIIHPGYQNSDAGPDFFNAKIKIDTTLWAGNVEIHLKKSDWMAHNHENNPNYANVILHVVLEDDFKPDEQSNLAHIPTLILYIPRKIKNNYQLIEQQKMTPICGKSLSQISKIDLYNYLEYILIERFEEKSISAQKILDKTNGCWSTLFYNLLVRTLGGHTNNPTFEQLAQHLPFKILVKHSNNLFQLEALLFGTAGFLTNPVDTYQKELQIEFNFLKIKYNIIPLSEHLWKFLRLRPSNFPTLRIAQLAAIIHKNRGLFEPQKTTKLITEPYQAEVSNYWKYHYHFSATSENKKCTNMGEQTIQMIVCNVVIPYLFIFYKTRGDSEEMQRIIEMMHQLPSEKNKIITLWSGFGINSSNLADSQALYHLFTRYCEPRNCLRCRIGQTVLTKYEF